MVVNLSDGAVSRVIELLTQQDQPNLKLRVYVTGGGCSGFQYGFTFDDHQNEDDFVMKKDQVTLLVDSMSVQFLEGATVDFLEDLQGSRFVVQNANAKATCGCGSSFSI